MVIGTLNNMAATKASITFKLTIGPDCDDDEVFYDA